MDNIEDPGFTGATNTSGHYPTFELAPEDFDPYTAEPRLLRKYGFPRRPDIKTEPGLRKLWDNVFASKPKLIKAELAVDHKRAKLKSERALKQDGVDFSPLGWGGFVAAANPPQQFNMVYGEWVVPAVDANIDNFNWPTTLAFWIGIDGNQSTDVLQAGTAAYVDNGMVSYYAWSEWFPADAVAVMNFAIKPGDYMIMMICAHSTTAATCYMRNKTTNIATSFPMSAEPGITLAGESVEWAAEVLKIAPLLPQFSSVTFNNCIASTNEGDFNLTSGFFKEIIGSADDPLKASSVATSVTVEFLKQA